jgi:DNA polymerase
MSIQTSDSHQEIELLRKRCIGCQACSQLVRTRTHVVFGEGDPNSPLVLVGEGPGETEDLLGCPFVGKAGQLLDKALEENGIQREEVYITNTIKCRACDEVNGKLRNRPPTDQEVENCRQWLFPQLRVIRPEIILCIGAPSARNLIKKDFKITAERGKYFPCKYARAAIATLHPAYILRNRFGGSDGGYSLLVADIAKAWAAAKELRAKRGSKIPISEFGMETEELHTEPIPTQPTQPSLF